MEFFTSLNIWYRRGIAAAIGGIAGYAYYYYIGCVSGTCPITSNPYITTLYGAAAGFFFISNNKKTEGHDHGTTDSNAAGAKI